MGRQAVTSTLDWDDKAVQAAVDHPLIVTADFDEHLRHPSVLGDILRDFLRLDTTDGSRNRATPDLEDGLARLQDLIGGDYSTDPFVEAFVVCTRGQSRTQVARRTGISRTQVHRIASGEVEPSEYELMAIASSYGRPPEWFAAYRAIVIMRMVRDELDRNPERSAVLLRRLR